MKGNLVGVPRPLLYFNGIGFNFRIFFLPCFFRQKQSHNTANPRAKNITNTFQTILDGGYNLLVPL